jgi:peptidoglycan hydrolase CwlO-like protein
MSENELRRLKARLAELDREAEQTDHSVDQLKASLAESKRRLRELENRAERVQRDSLAAA